MENALFFLEKALLCEKVVMNNVFKNKNNIFMHEIIVFKREIIVY